MSKLNAGQSYEIQTVGRPERDRDGYVCCLCESKSRAELGMIARHAYVNIKCLTETATRAIILRMGPKSRAEKRGSVALWLWDQSRPHKREAEIYVIDHTDL